MWMSRDAEVASSRRCCLLMAFDQFSRFTLRSWRVSMVYRNVALLALCCAVALPPRCHAAPAVSPTPTAQSQGYGQPDVQVLIFPSAGGDMIDLTYPGIVPPTQAERDVTAVLHAGGWHTSGRRYQR